MAPKLPQSAARIWFHRSVALTLAVGACLILLIAVRPGYGAFFVTSTLAFLVAGLLWSPGDPPHRGFRARPTRRPVALAGALNLARSYRISIAR
jgi:hypothetical protein